MGQQKLSLLVYKEERTQPKITVKFIIRNMGDRWDSIMLAIKKR